MQTGSLAAALEHEHHEIDDGIATFTASPGDRQPLARAVRALRRHIYLEEEFLFPLLRQAEPGLAAPVFVMRASTLRYGPCSTRWNATSPPAPPAPGSSSPVS